VRAGRLRAARIVKPDLSRLVTLARARQGSLTPALRIVIMLLKEISLQLADAGEYHEIEGEPSQ
jgi:LysR family transcriptional regulator, nitrogen assimilation regulatory protein